MVEGGPLCAAAQFWERAWRVFRPVWLTQFLWELPKGRGYKFESPVWLDQASPVRRMVHLLAVILNTDPATIHNLKEGIHNSIGVPCKKPLVCGMHAWRWFSGSESQTILKSRCALHKLGIKSYFNSNMQNRIFGPQRVLQLRKETFFSLGSRWAGAVWNADFSE